ncbi:acyltransferase family protein [Chelatococcus reniformis]|uniref:Exopolysaccharide production protein ExoZ n=1 Tax=Chelatococcus reniformis TaxID=1494448 RepID=A0A916UWA1_9HYPH|nr:acyltransferase [Chelatococcus reniformis]GGC88188.1 exopolysaccharide production protein ExoZ [Chelatococcus reniformis]
MTRKSIPPSSKAVASAPGGQPTLLGLQVLRALAALAVAIHHVQHEAAQLVAQDGRSFSASHVLPWLAGVDVFFVISGFIMVLSSARLFARPGASRVFLSRRLIRIVPIYWAATGLFLVVMLLTPQALNSPRPEVWQVVASLLFIPYARPDGLVQPVYSLGWTLNYEMLFYVLFGAAIGLPRHLAVAAVTALLALAVALGLALGPLPEPLAYWTQPIVLEFVLGMGLGLLYARGVRLPLAVRAGLAVAALLALHADLPQTGAFGAFGNVIGYGVPGALLVVAAAFGHAPGKPPRFETALATLGDASYALYLVHPFAIRFASQALVAAHLAPNVPAAAFIAVGLVVAVAAALAVHRWFEQPVLRLLRRRVGV